MNLAIACLIFISCQKEADYEIVVGEDFSIDVETDIATGYIWEWTNMNDVNIVNLTEHITFAPDTINGGKCVERFVFTGVRKGFDTIILEYHRSFSNQVLKTKKITVFVE